MRIESVVILIASKARANGICIMDFVSGMIISSTLLLNEQLQPDLTKMSVRTVEAESVEPAALLSGVARTDGFVKPIRDVDDAELAEPAALLSGVARTDGFVKPTRDVDGAELIEPAALLNGVARTEGFVKPVRRSGEREMDDVSPPC